MRKGFTSLGRQLRSVALRYQWPARGWPPELCWRGPKWFLRTTISEEPSASAAVSQSRSKRLACVEAAFFLAREPQSSRRLAQLAGLADGTEARTLVRTLNRLYDAEGCAFRVEEVAGGLQLMSRSKFAPWLRRLHAAAVEVRLSGPAMETLAVIAYRQPVLRAEIEAIRGVQCGELLRQLMDRDLVRIVGRSEELGRPFLYGTTRRFLQIFGLRHLEELPRPDSFCRTENAPGNPPGLNRDASASDNGMFIHPDKLSQKQEATVKAPATMDLSARLTEQPPFIIIPLGQNVPLESAANRFEKAYADKDDADEPFDDDDEFEDDVDDDDDDEEDDEDDDLDDEDLEDDEWEEIEDDDDLDEDEDDDEDEDWDDEEWDDDDDDDDDEDDDEDEFDDDE
jgi:segregation and condensation protein B